MILLGIDENNNSYSWKAKNNLCSIFKSLNDYEINYYLPSVLEKVDAASMLSSLEVRVPYLSNNIVNYLDEVSIWNFILRRTAKFHLRKLLSFDTSKNYAFSSKKGFSFYRKDQVNFIIEYLENRKYKVLLKKNLEEKIKKNKIQYIRLLLLKHWIFGFN